MKINGGGKLRNLNPANPLKKEDNNNINNNKCYYVDLDGTLAYYERWGAEGDIGEPIPIMKNWISYWLSKGIEIVIFTARAYKQEHIDNIRKWLILNGLPIDLRITNVKGLDCSMILDDKAREVISNTGQIVDRVGEFNIGKLEE